MAPAFVKSGADIGESGLSLAESGGAFNESGLRLGDIAPAFGNSCAAFEDVRPAIAKSSAAGYDCSGPAIFQGQGFCLTPEFPKKRAEILSLTHKIENAMTQHPDAFAKCLVTLAEVQSADDAQNATSNTRVDKQAELDAAITADQNAVGVLSDRAKTVLEYAKSARRQFPDILKWLDWEDAEPTALVAPGALRGFEIQSQTPGSVTFDYKAPLVGKDAGKGEGGAAAFYKIVWRLSVSDEWQDAASDVDLDIAVNLNRWPRGTIVEFAGVAVNKKGPGPVSNGISVSV